MWAVAWLAANPDTLPCKSHCQGQKITSPGAQPGCVHLPRGFAGCEIKSASHLQWHPGLGESPAHRLTFLRSFTTPWDPPGLYRCQAGMAPPAIISQWDPRAFPASGKGGPPQGDGPFIRLAVGWASPPPSYGSAHGRHGTPPSLPLVPRSLGISATS